MLPGIDRPAVEHVGHDLPGSAHAAVVDPDVGDLADDMLMDKAPISRSASRLVERGLLIREADPADGRSAVFTLTAEGRKTASAIMASARTGQSRYMDLLPPEDCWVLLAAVDKILDFAKTKIPKGEPQED